MVKIKIIEKDSEFYNLSNIWNKLLLKSETKSPFLTWEWMYIWWSMFKQKRGLYILYLLNSENNPIGIAPLMINEKRMFNVPVRYIEFIGTDESLPDYLDFIIDKSFEDEAMRAIVECLIDNSNQWDIISFSGTSSNSFCYKSKQLFEDHKLSTFTEHCGTCPYINLPNTWDKYLSTLSKKSRFNVNKKRRSLDNDFENSFYIMQNEEKLEDTMNQLALLHKKRMSSKGINGYSTSDIFWEFQTKVSKELIKNNRLFIGVLSIKDKIVACQYGFNLDNKIYHYQTGFDISLNKYSIGLVSIGYMIESAITEGFREYDFLRGDESYKYHWAKSYRKLYSIYIIRDFTGRIMLRGRFLKESLKTKIKEFKRSNHRL